MPGRKPLLALLYGAGFWGVVWYPLRILEEAGMTGSWLALVSYGSAFLLLLPFALGAWRDFRRQPWSLFTLALAAGWTNLAFVWAVLDGEVVRVILLFYLSPLWAVLLARVLLHEAFTRLTALVLLCGIGGMLVMEWRAGLTAGRAGTADWLAVSSGMAFALSNVMTRRLDATGVRTKTLVAWVGVVLVSGSAILLSGAAAPDVAAEVWGGTLALGLLGFFAATLAVVYGVSRMPVQRSAVIMLFEILVAALTSWWLAGEQLELREVIGGALIVVAGLIAVFYRA